MILRPYQTRAIEATLSLLMQGRNVCLVAPTGSGKTMMGAAICAQLGGNGLWLAHRTELVRQAQLSLLGVAGHTLSEHCTQAEVDTVQSAVNSPSNKPSWIVLDECHHYESDRWGQIADRYPGVPILGLTATPQRGDGRALDTFDSIVVAAQYSELIDAGYLVDAHVYSPGELLDGLAQDPVAAYRRYCPDQSCFAYFGSVRESLKQSLRFIAAGIPAVSVTAETDPEARSLALEKLADGRLRVVCNVYTMTEGVDIPNVSAVLVARKVQHSGMWLQICGRGLRPSPGKAHATVVDLTGAALKHGSPTQDRTYSLSGAGIQKESLSPLRNCLQCGACYHAQLSVCPRCGYAPPTKPVRPPRIYDLELARVFDGANTAEVYQQRELDRLCAKAVELGHPAQWVIREFKRLFSKAPTLVGAPHALKQRELARLSKTAASRGFKRGYVGVRFKQIFGHWPGR